MHDVLPVQLECVAVIYQVVYDYLLLLRPSQTLRVYTAWSPQNVWLHITRVAASLLILLSLQNQFVQELSYPRLQTFHVILHIDRHDELLLHLTRLFGLRVVNCQPNQRFRHKYLWFQQMVCDNYCMCLLSWWPVGLNCLLSRKKRNLDVLFWLLLRVV